MPGGSPKRVGLKPTGAVRPMRGFVKDGVIGKILPLPLTVAGDQDGPLGA
jgi:hypothetical protein